MLAAWDATLTKDSAAAALYSTWRTGSTPPERDLTRPIAERQAALEAGLTALKLDPDQPATRVAVATVYQGMGQYDAAIDQLKRAFDLQPSNDDAHRIFGRVLNAQGNTVTVTLTYQWIPEGMFGGMTLSSTSVMPMAN